jgi:hypothetical protein
MSDFNKYYVHLKDVDSSNQTYIPAVLNKQQNEFESRDQFNSNQCNCVYEQSLFAFQNDIQTLCSQHKFKLDVRSQSSQQRWNCHDMLQHLLCKFFVDTSINSCVQFSLIGRNMYRHIKYYKYLCAFYDHCIKLKIELPSFPLSFWIYTILPDINLHNDIGLYHYNVFYNPSLYNFTEQDKAQLKDDLESDCYLNVCKSVCQLAQSEGLSQYQSLDDIVSDEYFKWFLLPHDVCLQRLQMFFVPLSNISSSKIEIKRLKWMYIFALYDPVVVLSPQIHQLIKQICSR